MPEQSPEALELDAARAKLRLWREVEPAYQKQFEDVLAPLESAALELKAKLVLCFDHACKQKELTRAERELASVSYTHLTLPTTPYV